MLKRLAVNLFSSLPSFRAAFEKGRWREIGKFAQEIGWPAAVRLWFGIYSKRGPASSAYWRICLPGYRYPLYFRPGGSDPRVIQQVFVNHEYAAVAELPKIKWIIDCGANIGCTTFLFMHKYPEAHAVVIEPDADNMRVCRRNLAPFRSRVTFLEAGVWPSSGPLKIERGNYRDGAEWSFQVRPAHPEEPFDVMGVTLPEVMANAGMTQIDLLKIDIEGAEAELMNGAADWLHVTRNLVIETHGPECAGAVSTALSPFGFEESTSGELTVFSDIRPTPTPASSREFV